MSGQILGVIIVFGVGFGVLGLVIFGYWLCALLSARRKAKTLIAEQHYLSGQSGRLDSKRSDLVCPQCKKLPDQCDCPMQSPLTVN